MLLRMRSEQAVLIPHGEEARSAVSNHEAEISEQAECSQPFFVPYAARNIRVALLITCSMRSREGAGAT